MIFSRGDLSLAEALGCLLRVYSGVGTGSSQVCGLGLVLPCSSRGWGAQRGWLASWWMLRATVGPCLESSAPVFKAWDCAPRACLVLRLVCFPPVPGWRGQGSGLTPGGMEGVAERLSHPSGLTSRVTRDNCLSRKDSLSLESCFLH